MPTHDEIDAAAHVCGEADEAVLRYVQSLLHAAMGDTAKDRLYGVPALKLAERYGCEPAMEQAFTAISDAVHHLDEALAAIVPGLIRDARGGPLHASDEAYDPVAAE